MAPGQANFRPGAPGAGAGLPSRGRRGCGWRGSRRRSNRAGGRRGFELGLPCRSLGPVGLLGEYRPHRVDQIMEVLFHGGRQGIQPVLGADKIFQRLGRHDVLDAEGNYGYAGVHRPFDLTLNLGRGVGIAGKNEEHGPTGMDGVNDGFAPVAAGQDVPGRDPAADAVGLQCGTDGVGGGLVLVGITDEDVVGHGSILSLYEAVRIIGVYGWGRRTGYNGMLPRCWGRGICPRTPRCSPAPRGRPQGRRSQKWVWDSLSLSLSPKLRFLEPNPLADGMIAQISLEKYFPLHFLAI